MECQSDERKFEAMAAVHLMQYIPDSQQPNSVFYRRSLENSTENPRFGYRHGSGKLNRISERRRKC